MRWLLFTLVPLALACGARTELGATGDAACAPREITVQVASEVAWTDTGIDVVAGQRIVMKATGTVRYGPQSNQVTGPNGGNFDGQKFFTTAVLPDTVVVSLIGKIGDSPLPEGSNGDGPGFVGSSYDEVAPASGRLYLGFNDQRQDFGDNGGSFVVTVTLGC